MLTQFLRNTYKTVLTFPWRIAGDAGFYSGPRAPVQFVIEKKDWAIQWVGESICREIETISPGKIVTTKSPQKIADRLIHFGSQYMWLDWGQHLSKKNQFVTSFFHGKPEDGDSIARHIDRFMASLPRLSMVVTAASLVEDRLLNWGVPREKLIRIPIGVNTKFFVMPTTEQRSAVRKRFDIPDQAIVVGSFQKDGIGWGDGTQPKLIKGPDIFIEALVILKSAGFPVMAFLTGPARGYLKEGLKKFGIPYIHVYANNHLELSNYYHALDLYLVTSREEGGPMGLMEAMSSGVPVVSTPVGMAPDLITDSITGGLTKSISAEEVAQKAISILNQTAGQNFKLRMEAREVVKLVDWSVIGRNHWDWVYQPLLKNA